ncbi:serine/threonine-protein kinase 11-interacting protein isoform X2 [Planococcus citri]|uniref:serine/threonine-protein kinase 11-interacting protein isoform X2 n=1 Tax=Planococcus citri TaxID=170843 RepID=UPI0031F99C15
MTSPEIKELIVFLQNNGRSVISGQKNFSVTPQILRELNKILRTIKEDIYVSPLSTTKLINKYASSNDLMFLYDFVTKMPKLKISDTSSSHSFTIDVSDFTNLKYLELYKFNVKDVKGIQFLRENLEIVVCTRCLDSIGDLILNSDSDNSVSLIWSKLQHAVFSCNGLSTLDRSFIYTPWLQYLDISYNNLTDLRPITCLSNLTHLNAAYNRLSSVPEMPISKLEVLLLNHNYITNISGLSKMVSLREIDLSENSIVEHVNLLPLADLSLLTTLHISKNPISYHPIHRSLTCGYLHENVANDNFLLDGTPLSTAEKEYIRYTSPSINNPEFCALRNTNSNILKKKRSKKTREAIIYEPNYDKEDSSISNVPTPIKLQESDDDEEYIKTKKQLEECRHQHGEEYWLLNNKFPGWLDIPSPNPSPRQSCCSSPRNTNIVAEHVFNSRSDPQTTNRIIENTFSNDDTIVTETSNASTSDKENQDNTTVNEDDQKTESSVQSSNSSSESESETDVEENDDNEDNVGFDGIEESSLWLVQRVDGDATQDLFLVLGDEDLREYDVTRAKVITKWSLEWVERCMKISNEPLTIMLKFDVARRNDQTRKYIMEYADAQKLISRVQEELEKRPMLSSNQKLCRCIKCNSLFCLEVQRRNKIGEQNPYVCPNCGSTHVLEEDESALWPKTYPDGVDRKNKCNVTSSPSLSSIGSAASLDQSCDTTNGSDDHPSNLQDSDVEIYSNPSQSSIEILEVHSSRSVDSNVTVVQRFETPSNLVSAAVNQLLTESSSSGSMTDSIITSYETNQHGTRGPHRISQSTVDEVLQEESSSETSPQQRRSEEKTTSDSDKSKNDKNTSNISTKLELPSFNYTTVFEAIKGRVPLTLTSSPRKSVPDNDLDTTYEYSYSDFTNIDHRIKYYIWDQLTPNSVEINAFLRVDKLSKCGTSIQPSPALLVLTEKKLYFVKIVKEEKDDPSNWLQKFDSHGTDKIKLIQPILWKQGFSIEVEDRSISALPLKYICLLYDESRTDNFLSHIKDLGIIHVKTSEELSEKSDLKTYLQLDDHVRNFSMTDLITISKNKDVKRFTLVGFIITNNDFVIVKGESEWLLPKTSIKPSIVQTESIGNLMKLTVKPSCLEFQFEDEIEKLDQSWEIKVNTLESGNKIIEAIREPWEDMFTVPLEVTYAAN